MTLVHSVFTMGDMGQAATFTKWREEKSVEHAIWGCQMKAFTLLKTLKWQETTFKGLFDTGNIKSNTVASKQYRISNISIFPSLV